MVRVPITITLSIDYEVKDKIVEILKKRGVKLSHFTENFYKQEIKKEENTNGILE